MDRQNIYLDNCCFNRPYDDQQSIIIRIEAEAKLFIQSEIKRSNIFLCWSYILSYENSKNNDILKKNTIEKWRELSFKVVEPTDGIDILADEIVKNGIKEIDAIHLACAIYGKCDYFKTTDKGILKKKSKINEIKILSPLEFIEYFAGGCNDD